MTTEKLRYSITLEDDMFKKIEDFRLEHRYQTRNQATIALIRMGLEATRKQQANPRKS